MDFKNTHSPEDLKEFYDDLFAAPFDCCRIKKSNLAQHWIDIIEEDCPPPHRPRCLVWIRDRRDVLLEEGK